MSNFQALKEACCEANIKLSKTGLIDFTFGNVSVLDSEQNVFAIKPSGVDYAELQPKDMVVLDMEGQILEGSLRPSSDTPTHRRLFQAFPGMHCVVHTHSRCATSFAQAGRDIPCLGTTHADYFYGSVPVTRKMTPQEIAGEYEWETGNVIVERFADLNPAEVNAVLVHSHGPFVWGPTPNKALENAAALEIIAQMATHSLQLNPEATGIQQELLDKHYKRKHGANAYYGQKP